ncbi:glycosyltransferase [uncultured Gulosibacter sp.]|uniref:glycosyltransferase n=1 Tax=uncultured Gulosibacter sp. TaxID=1339167 RepID=UPI002889A9B4|nr:glycosyltransferase [uncultured Gulosibacter sp.]
MNAIVTATAIVVTWNGGAEAVAAVRSLLDQHVPAGMRCRVVAADNGSSDDTVARIRAEAPEAEVLELRTNLGYGAAANRAMAAYPADAYLVLNQDAVYQPGFVAALLTELANDEQLGAVTAQVQLAGEFIAAELDTTAAEVFVGHDGARWRRTREGERGERLINSTGNQLTRSGNGVDRGWLAPVGTEFPRSVLGFHGGACALRAEAVRALGGFDERYFMYYEDTDLSLRMRAAGWSVAYVPDAVSVHQHAGSSGTASPGFVEWNARNRAWNARRNGPVRMRVAATGRTLAGAVKGALVASDPRRPRDERELGRARARGALAGVFARVGERRKPAVDEPTPLQYQVHLDADGDVPAPRTLIDLTSVPLQLGGVGRYLEGLLTGFEAIGFNPVLVCRAEHQEHFAALAPSAELHVAPRAIAQKAARFAWEQTGLLRLTGEVRAEVIHSPHYSFPRGTPLRRVVTLHDATFFSDPDAHTALKRRFFTNWIRAAVRADVWLITPSAATAGEIERYAGRPRRAMTVALHGVDRNVFHEPTAAEVAAFRDKYELGDRPYIAFLGTIEPRKRVAQLIRAHRILQQRLGADAPLLLISGQRGWDAEAIELLDAAGADSGVRELGYLPLDELRSLLGGASAFCYPSIAEGFGLPVLEAMSAGAAVVTTNRTALPEVGGDAVVYAEPEPAALADALEKILTDADSAAGLRAAGLARAAEFTWERCARIHVDAYSRAAHG